MTEHIQLSAQERNRYFRLPIFLFIFGFLVVGISFAIHFLWQPLPGFLLGLTTGTCLICFFLGAYLLNLRKKALQFKEQALSLGQFEFKVITEVTALELGWQQVYFRKGEAQYTRPLRNGQELITIKNDGSQIRASSINTTGGTFGSSPKRHQRNITKLFENAERLKKGVDIYGEWEKLQRS